MRKNEYKKIEHGHCAKCGIKFNEHNIKNATPQDAMTLCDNCR